jgi:hypothetical protein
MARRHLAFALAAGCQTAPAPRTIAVTAQVPDGELILTRTAGGCAAAGTTITVAGAEARGGTWRLAPGPTGLALTNAEALVARIVDEPGPPPVRIYLDPIGVPLARISTTDDSAAVVGADRSPIATLSVVDLGAAAFTYRAADGAAGTVTGTRDPALAAALIAPSAVPPLGRAVVACPRLVATSPSPAS